MTRILISLATTFILVALTLAAIHLKPAQATQPKAWKGDIECYSDAPIHSSTWDDHDCASTVQRF
jgi:hypothetical protein